MLERFRGVTTSKLRKMLKRVAKRFISLVLPCLKWAYVNWEGPGVDERDFPFTMWVNTRCVQGLRWWLGVMGPYAWCALGSGGFRQRARFFLFAVAMLRASLVFCCWVSELT